MTTLWFLLGIVTVVEGARRTMNWVEARAHQRMLDAVRRIQLQYGSRAPGGPTDAGSSGDPQAVNPATEAGAERPAGVTAPRAAAAPATQTPVGAVFPLPRPPASTLVDTVAAPDRTVSTKPRRVTVHG
jgi:hypothetical protein